MPNKMLSSTAAGRSIRLWALQFSLVQRWLWKKHKLLYPPQQSASLRGLSPLPGTEGKRVLFFEDRVPHLYLGMGYPRSNRILSDMVALGYFVTFYPCIITTENRAEMYRDIPQEVEVMLEYGFLGLHEFLRMRRGFYDLVFVSRPHNMSALRPFLFGLRSFVRQAAIIYDAEALFALREMARRRLMGSSPTLEEEQNLIREEVKMVDGCRSVVCVSEAEGRHFREHGVHRVHSLSHCIEAAPTPASWEDRTGILFVGALQPDSPNTDSVLWFIHEVLPRIRAAIGSPVEFWIAGINTVEQIAALDDETIHVLGKVDDLIAFYNRARLFVAPTRYGAGLPIKIIEAAAYGLPTVSTSILAQQLNWQSETELLVADGAEAFATACCRLYQTPDLWQKLRVGALQRIRADYAPPKFRDTLQTILEAALNSQEFETDSGKVLP